MLDDKIKEELANELKECIKDVCSYTDSLVDVNLVYDTKNKYVTSYTSTGNTWVPYYKTLLVLHSDYMDWLDYLGDIPCYCELNALLRGESEVGLTYSQDIIDEAKRIVEDEDLVFDVDFDNEAEPVLEKCGATDVIKKAMINENIDYYMEEEFDKLLDEAIEAYNEYINEKEIDDEFER